MIRLNDIINIKTLFFPHLCISCRKEAPVKNEPFCLSCELEMPYTDHFTNPDNTFVKHFWGRIEIRHGAALLEYRKEGKVREMIHAFKYRKKKDVGIRLGMHAAKLIRESRFFNDVEVIIPVPVSKKKERTRGYNQSLIFSEGLRKINHVEVADNVLLKIRDTGSQTSRNRSDRLDNVAGSFIVTRKDKIIGKHILLVDDVITTGATLESCARLLLDSGVNSISCLTLAIARN